MATFNDYPVNARSNRPNVLGRTLLEHLNINNGSYEYPFLVSSVTILPDVNGDPSIYLDRDLDSERYGLLSDDAQLASLATFETKADGTYYDISNYDPLAPGWSTSVEARGIYDSGVGRLSIVLDGNITDNAPSSVGNYYDVWTVYNFENSKPVTHFHKFALHNDTVVSLTEPLLITPTSKLINKYVNQGSVIDLKIQTDYTVNNRSLPDDVRNIFKDSVVMDAEVYIHEVTKTPHTQPFNVIYNWVVADSITADDTIISNLDTTELNPGTYIVKARYKILNELYYTDDFTLVIR